MHIAPRGPNLAEIKIKVKANPRNNLHQSLSVKLFIPCRASVFIGSHLKLQIKQYTREKSLLSGLLCVANGHSLSKAQDIHKLIKAIIYSTHCKILPTALEIIYQLFPINKGVY